MQNEAIFREFALLESARSTFEEQWQQIADYGLGRRDFITRYFVGGRPRQHLIYNATFQDAADEAAASLIYMSVNPFSRWMWIEDPDPDLMRIPQIAEFYELETEQLYRIFNDPRSGFYTAAHEQKFDWVSFGSANFYVDMHHSERRIMFQGVPLAASFAMEDGYGYVDTMYRKFILKAHQAFDLWGEDAGSNVYDKQQKRVKQPNEDVEFLQVVMPRKQAEQRRFMLNNMPFQSLTLNVKTKEVVREKGYWENPFMFSRFSKDPGEVYGRGPGQAAIADAKMLTRMDRTLLVAAEKAADPPLIVADDGVIGPMSTEPNGVNVVRATGTGQTPLSYLVNQSRMDLPQERHSATEERVRKHFYNDLLSEIADPRLNIPQVLELSARAARRIGAPLYRDQTEWLEPVVQRTYALASRAGMMLPRPEILRGRPIKVTYISPAARAQLHADVQSILGLAAAGMEWSQVDQDVLDNLDWDEAFRMLARAYGNVSKAVRSTVDLETIRRAKEQSAMKQQQMVEAGAMADFGKKAAEAYKAVQAA